MKELSICRFYTTSGYPNFNPKCIKGHKASKECHEKREDCGDYKPSLTKKPEKNSCFFTILGLTAIAVCFATLRLWLSFASEIAAITAWSILLVQRRDNDRK